MSDASEQLGKLADIQYGKSPNEVLAEDGRFPIVGTGGKYGHAMRAMFQGPAIVVPRKGSLGNPQLLMEPFWPVDTTYAVIPEKGVDVRWLYYNLLNFDLTKLNEATGVPSISRDWLKKIRFFDPGKEPRKEIGNILQATDDAIEKTESLIAKYQQIKAGLMHDLFTHGVSAGGKLRPSREQAPELYHESPIGWIPKEWKVVKMVELAQERGGSTTIGPFGSDLVAADYRPEGVPVVFVRDVKEAGFEWNSDTYISEQKARQLSAHSVVPGDVLATKMGLPPCISCVYPQWMPNGVITADMIRLSPDIQKVDSYWLSAAINHDRVRRQVAAITAGVTRPKVTLSDFRNIKIARPDLEEQKLIRARLGDVQGSIDKESANRSKLVLQKAGLMHDLLTGKVRAKVHGQENTI